MKIMAVDFGESRTGIAISDIGEFLATPHEVIKEKNTQKAIEKIAQKAKDLSAEMVVVGLAKNMDGSLGERAQKCIMVKEKLSDILDIPVELWDERVSTKSALNILSNNNTYGKKRKEILDSVAASVILESFLQYRKNNKEL